MTTAVITRVAVKTSEGYGRSEEQLPVDIDSSKLIDWLVSRQQLSADWRKRLQVIQSKAADAWRGLPADVVSRLQPPADRANPDASPPDYFVACQVRDALAVGAGKTVLGYLKGEAGVWDAIVRAYKSKGVWLGEAATTLARNADYEIPCLKAQALKLDQQLVDAERRSGENLRLAGAAATEYRQELSQLGIEGTSVRRELRALAAQLPSIFSPAVERLRDGDVADAIAHYVAFAQYAHPSSAAAEVDAAAAFLPTLRNVRDGTVSAGSEAEHPQQSDESSATAVLGSSDASDDAAVSSALPPADGGAPIEISWDLDASPGVDAAPADGDTACISWDVEVTSDAMGHSGEVPAGISWEVDMGPIPMAESGHAAAAAVPSEDAQVEIDWGVEMEAGGAAREDGAAAISIDWDADIGDSSQADEAQLRATAGGGNSERACSPEDRLAAALAADSDFRNRLLDDLHELRAFLLQRAAEQSAAASASLAAPMPEDLQLWETSGVGFAALQAIDTALQAFCGPRAMELLMLQGSERFTTSMVLALERQAGKEAKYRAAAQEAETKRQQAQVARVQAAQRLAALQKRTAAVKAEIEGALLKALDRQVNIVGEINNLL